PNINLLPDLCLLAILSFLPLSDLFTTPLVCSRWNSLTRETCRRKRKLAIFREDTHNYAQTIDEMRFFDAIPTADSLLTTSHWPWQYRAFFRTLLRKFP